MANLSSTHTHSSAGDTIQQEARAQAGATASNRAFIGLLVLVNLSPLPLGGFRPLAWSFFGLFAALLLAYWTRELIRGQVSVTVPIRQLRWALLLFLVVPFYGLIQTMPAPLASLAHPIWQEAHGALRGFAPPMAPPAATISVNADLTYAAIIRLLTYSTVFWLALQLGRERSRARLGLVTFAWAGVIYAIYGLAINFSGSRTVLGFEKWAYKDDVTATFINHGAYAAFAGLGLLSCLVLFAHGLRAGDKERGAFNAADTIALRAAPYLAGALVLGSALLLSHSRGGLIASGVAIIVMIFCLAGARMIKLNSIFVTVTALVLASLFVIGINGEGTLSRLMNEGITDESRAQIYRLTIAAIGDAPWTGHGLGTFISAFKPYRDLSLPGLEIVNMAHNSYLELAMDVGVVAAGLFYLSLGLLVAACLRGIAVRRRDVIHPILAIAAGAQLFVVSFVDFAGQIPGVAIPFAYLLGVGCAQSFPGRSFLPEKA